MRGAKRLIQTRPAINGGSDSVLTHFIEGQAGGCPSKAMADPPGTQTLPQIDVEEKLKTAFTRGWSVIVWNDPVNLMDYVVYVFKTVLKMNEKDASKHMWEVHQKGKSMVARETREKSELLVHRLRSFGLNATMEQEPA
jgi:ATP-dependent Clp protease adaptor protein ClpS